METVKRVIGTDELKDYQADAFNPFEDGEAGMWLCILVIVCIVMEPYFR